MKELSTQSLNIDYKYFAFFAKKLSGLCGLLFRLFAQRFLT
jgi:hypothetical protein